MATLNSNLVLFSFDGLNWDTNSYLPWPTILPILNVSGDRMFGSTFYLKRK